MSRERLYRNFLVESRQDRPTVKGEVIVLVVSYPSRIYLGRTQTEGSLFNIYIS